MDDHTPPDVTYELLNPEGRAPVLLVCDHASNYIPPRYADLGLQRELLTDNHIAWDIGAAAVTRRLAERFDCPAILAGFSRLLIDPNRQPGDPTSIAPVSDGIEIPGNRQVDDEEADYRLETFFWPYHHAITHALAQLWRHGPAPALISVHSFTPIFSGLHRPWQIGVMWNHDPRVAQPLIRWLRERHPDLCVGDNEPYSGRDTGFTVDHHAGAAGLPHMAVEIRQDLITDSSGQADWTALLGEALEAVLSNASLHQVEHY
jgi:predicted N-formylglutamate amidohydrolase